MKMRSVVLLVLTMAISGAMAQEFNAQVSVLPPRIMNFEPRIYKSLENSILDFMNNRRFTNFNYAVEERIEINIVITIQEHQTIDQFNGKIQVTYSRPVYGTEYNTAVINLLDKDFTFQYLENTQIEFTPERFQNNLSHVLGFYAYFILGVDGDTFKELGGTEFYNLAQQVVNSAQNANHAGWKAFEGTKNRYWLVDNQLQNVFRPLRKCLYQYHRLGFDTMNDDVVAARKVVSASIDGLKSIHQTKPASYNLQVFFTAKADELVNLFKQADSREKAKLFNTLQIIDPANLSKYQQMMRNG